MQATLVITLDEDDYQFIRLGLILNFVEGEYTQDAL